MPFSSPGADAEQEYFSDGLAEELINALAGLGGLRVVSRTSAFRFRSRDLDIREIGRQLNVETILEGSIRRSGKRLRITAQLINVADGYHLWSQRYDRELEDVFAIQDEITESIVRTLKPTLLGGQQPIARRYRLCAGACGHRGFVFDSSTLRPRESGSSEGESGEGGATRAGEAVHPQTNGRW